MHKENMSVNFNVYLLALYISNYIEIYIYVYMYVLCVCEYGYILTSKTQTSFYASDILLGKLNLYILLAAGKLLNLCKPVSSSEE